jgi:hypothetical protein
MTRSILAVMAVGTFLAVITAPSCKATGVGDPCTPEQEYDPTFGGFDEKEVNVESKSFQCQTRLCLVNHFRGRVSCPYGQASDGTSPPGIPPLASGEPDPNTKSCVVPGTTIPIVPNDPKLLKAVRAQITGPGDADRTANKAVYCSCRCANVDGQTNDGANYCTCPDGFACTQLVSSIGPTDTGLTGAYCIKNGTNYDPNNVGGNDCAPVTNPCPNAVY